MLTPVLASIPLVGAWAASKWMIPWADKLASAAQPSYKAVVQGWWALGATLGSFVPRTSGDVYFGYHPAGLGAGAGVGAATGAGLAVGGGFDPEAELADLDRLGVEVHAVETVADQVGGGERGFHHLLRCLLN